MHFQRDRFSTFFNFNWFDIAAEQPTLGHHVGRCQRVHPWKIDELLQKATATSPLPVTTSTTALRAPHCTACHDALVQVERMQWHWFPLLWYFCLSSRVRCTRLHTPTHIQLKLATKSCWQIRIKVISIFVPPLQQALFLFHFFVAFHSCARRASLLHFAVSSAAAAQLK